MLRRQALLPGLALVFSFMQKGVSHE